MKETAKKYLRAGLCVLPARRDQKRPTIPWKAFQKRLPTESEIDAFDLVYASPDPTGVDIKVKTSIMDKVELEIKKEDLNTAPDPYPKQTGEEFSTNVLPAPDSQEMDTLCVEQLSDPDELFQELK